ncbi:MAG TPA: toll/interleukin-1 receptor domain-containing protein, partial [Thermoanaerobaculia bacterium]|nr:toll/interleukin-1 receptor domain-containing protein [Thermoanaerobaculia bacterium]
MTPKRLFISYAWESEEYRLWVKQLAVRLRDDGVESRLDDWHLRETDILAEFMSREIRDADWVLVLCSPAYQLKVQAADGDRISGVRWEARLLTGRLLMGHESKILAALGQGTWKEAAPDFLLGQVYCDLSDPATFEAHYRTLLQQITGTAEKAPPVGTLPAHLAPELVKPLHGPAPAGSGDVELRFKLRPDGGSGWGVELRVDGGAPAAARCELDLASPDS